MYFLYIIKTNKITCVHCSFQNYNFNYHIPTYVSFLLYTYFVYLQLNNIIHNNNFETLLYITMKFIQIITVLHIIIIHYFNVFVDENHNNNYLYANLYY